MMLITPNEIEVAFLIGNFKKSVKIGTIMTPPPIPENANLTFAHKVWDFIELER